MSLSRMLCGMAVGFVSGAALGAATGAASGAVGAKIMDDAGYEGYDVSQAAQMSAVGNSIMGAGEGLLVGALAGCGLFSNLGRKSTTTRSCGLVASYTGGQLLGGMIGFGIYLSSNIAEMGFAESVVSTTIGATVTAIPVTCVVVCAVACAFGAAAANSRSNLAEKVSEMIDKPMTFSA